VKVINTNHREIIETAVYLYQHQLRKTGLQFWSLSPLRCKCDSGFTDDIDMRMQAGCARLQRMVDYAEQKGAVLYLENLNNEPADAEVHYLAHTVAEWMYYFDRIRSPNFRMSFTANHAHLVPDGVDGFIDAIDFARVGEVRLADCRRLGKEEHLQPGAGNLDFGNMFKRIEAKGFKGHYMNAFGTLDGMLAGREYEIGKAREAGVAT